jgi:hypothetical protein
MTTKALIKKARRLTTNQPRTRRPSLEFLRNWAFGNAGIENSKITRSQVEKIIKSVAADAKSA